VTCDVEAVRRHLLDLAQPVTVVWAGGQFGILDGAGEGPSFAPAGVVAERIVLPPVLPSHLGDPAFRQAHGVALAYEAGPMANGIASEELVLAMGRQRLLACFGAAGVVPTRLEAAIRRIQQALPDGPYAFNLIHSPSEAALEQRAVDLYLAHGVRTVEASAYLDLTQHVVRYRAAGLRVAPNGRIVANNRVVAKVSRREVAAKFLAPAPGPLLAALAAQGLITPEQAALAAHVPVCDDLTVEADSGGHTDNRPLVCLLPSVLALRDEVHERHGFGEPVRVGAAGGIGTPEAVLAAFAMGAAYVVTGSINQSCLEAGTSAHTKGLLAQAGMADVIMAPAADMFELGVKVQLLKRGTLFPMRAQRLYELYRTYDSVDAIPADERDRLERQVFRRSLDDVWRDTTAFFTERDPEQLTRAAGNPKRKLALLFRWYLGLSSRWSNAGEPGRETDYQIWCGPAMGAFNDWVRGSYLEAPEQRRVADVAGQLMAGAAYLFRVQQLAAALPPSVALPAALRRCRPLAALSAAAAGSAPPVADTWR
jgi:PfaD family protein